MSKKSDLEAEIAQTKAQLAAKLEQLEGQLRHDASSAKESLDGAVDNVKAAAKMFSLSHQIEQRPLLLAGGAMISGIVFTRWLVGGPAPSSPPPPRGERRVSNLLKSVTMGLLVDLVVSKAKARWKPL